MSKKKKTKKRKPSTLGIQRAQGILFRLSIKCSDALMLDPEHYPEDKQNELRQFSTDVQYALEKCRAGELPDMDFIDNAILEAALPKEGQKVHSPGFFFRAGQRLKKQLLG